MGLKKVVVVPGIEEGINASIIFLEQESTADFSKSYFVNVTFTGMDAIADTNDGRQQQELPSRMFLRRDLNEMQQQQTKRHSQESMRALDLFVSEDEIPVSINYEELEERVATGSVEKFHLSRGAIGSYQFQTESDDLNGIAFADANERVLEIFACFNNKACAGEDSRPSESPTNSPTVVPSFSPTKTPSSSPTGVPTVSPTTSHAPNFTNQPSNAPTVSSRPTESARPSTIPTQYPTSSPTAQPSPYPSLHPSATPTASSTMGIPEPATFAFSQPKSNDYPTSGTINFVRRYTFDISTGAITSFVTMKFVDIDPPNAPGAKIYLSPVSGGKKINEVGVIPVDIEQAEKNGWYTVEGSFEQNVPGDYDENSNYQQVIIWCEPFDVYIGGGTIEYLE